LLQLNFGIKSQHSYSQTNALAASVINVPASGLAENDTGGKVSGDADYIIANMYKVYVAIQ